MIITGVKSEVTAAGLTDVSKAKLKPSVHGMRLLSSQLYTMPIRAIVREICTNALDANKLTGSTKPFIVVMPTKSDSTFYVKDNGPGISEYRMLNEFLTFFETDKGGSNDQIGGFGLGSKSPYSYCDHFTIVSKYDGKRCSYIAFTNEQDEFVIGKASEEPCGNETGLEVCVPVKANDFDDFKDAVTHYIPHFPKGSVRVMGLALDPLNFKHELPSCKILADSGESYIKVGPVPYAVDWYTLSRKIENVELELLTDHQFEFEVPIGAVHIHPSREKLNLTDYTIDVIRDLAAAAIEDVRQYKIEAVESCATLWEAMGKYADLCTTFDTGHSETFAWRGADHPTSIQFSPGNIITRSDLGPRAPIIDLVDRAYITPTEQTRVIIHDMLEEKTSKVRIKRRLMSAFYEHSGTDKFVLVKDVSVLGDVPKELVSNLSDHAVPKGPSNPKKAKVKLRVYRNSNRKFVLAREIAGTESLEQITQNENACWVPMKLSTCTLPNLYDYHDLPTIRHNWTVYGFSGAVQRLVDTDKMLSIQQAYDRRVAEILNNDDLIEQAVLSTHQSGIQSFRSRYNTNFYCAMLDYEYDEEARQEIRDAFGSLDADFHDLFKTEYQKTDGVSSRDLEDVFYLRNNNLLPAHIEARFVGHYNPVERYENLLAKYPLIKVFNKMNRLSDLSTVDKITLIKSIMDKPQ